MGFYLSKLYDSSAKRNEFLSNFLLSFCVLRSGSARTVIFNKGGGGTKHYISRPAHQHLITSEAQRLQLNPEEPLRKYCGPYKWPDRFRCQVPTFTTVVLCLELVENAMLRSNISYFKGIKRFLRSVILFLSRSAKIWAQIFILKLATKLIYVY